MNFTDVGNGKGKVEFTAENKKLLEREVDIANYKHLDLSTYQHVNEEAHGLSKLAGAAVASLAHLSGYTAEHDNLFEFAFNDSCLVWIERYLDAMVKPHVGKWGKGKDELVVLEPQGEQMAHLNARFFIASRVLGQCLAQQHGLHWTPNGMALMRGTNDNDYIGVWAKVRKYVKFGAEDGLVGYSKTIGNWGFNQQVHEIVQHALKTKQPKEPGPYVFQNWHDEEGRVVKVIVYNEAKSKILMVHEMATVTDGKVNIGQWGKAKSFLLPDGWKDLPPMANDDPIAKAVGEALRRRAS